jgi:hypothetical protein
MPATNRWGHTFRKGDIVQDHRGYRFRYVKIAPSNDFSRAYGRQAVVDADLTGPLNTASDWTVNLADLLPVPFVRIDK